MSKRADRASDLDLYLAEHPEDADALRTLEPMITLARAFLELRAALGVSQKDFAATAGMTPSQISEYENASSSGITIQTLCRIANAAGAGLRVYFNLRVPTEAAGKICAGVVGLLDEPMTQTSFKASFSSPRDVREGVAA